MKTSITSDNIQKNDATDLENVHVQPSDVQEHIYFPVAGIGASAGGVEALSELFQHLDSGLGMAYVVIMHLSRRHKSALAKILQPHTTMKVQTVKEGMRVLPDHVYVIPPNSFMCLADGNFRLAPRSVTDVGNFAIDYFMTTLASTYKNNSIGILLSGTATDGTLGMKAIKAEGGITFAQDNSAKFPGMPRNAFDSGYADFLAPPHEIAVELQRLVNSRYTHSSIESIQQSHESVLDSDQQGLKNILANVKVKSGVDFFENYKHSSILRRLARRMVLTGIENFTDYDTYLKDNTKEVDALFDDLLINVTEFFRDTDFFTVLNDTVFPSLVKDRIAIDPIRIWIAGCSTGEEAYSIAISLIEFLELKELPIPMQIFASDIDITAIEKARLGRYPLSSIQKISENRLKKHFTKSDGYYQVNKYLREFCVFSKHDLLRDPPFSRVDLISCQNVLIYLETSPQTKILQTFHYALKPDGFLFLGKSESIGASTDNFLHSGKKGKLFKRAQKSPSLDGLTSSSNTGSVQVKTRQSENRRDFSIEQDIGKLLLAKYVPPCILVNKNLTIIQFYGPISPFLEPVTGKASFNVLKIIREDLVIYLRSLIHEAAKTGVPAIKENIAVIRNEIYQDVTIEVVPRYDSSGEILFLVIFKEKNSPSLPIEDPVNNKVRPSSDLKDKTILNLQKQLSESRGLIRSSNEEYETTFEELQAYNEEILSSNEELQSVNEELETSREELQSSVEELSTTNEELLTRNNELNDSRLYAHAIVETIFSPLLVLTSNHHITMANSAFYRTFKMTPAEVDGKLISEIGARAFDIPDLLTNLKLLTENDPQFREFELRKTFPGLGELTLKVHAYILRQVDSLGETLILLVFNNLSDLLKANRELQLANEQIAEFVFVSSHHLQEPLRKIQLFSDYMGQDEAHLNDFANHFLKKINHSVLRISSLVRDLANFTLLTQGGKVTVKVNLNQIISNVIANLELEIQDKKCEVRLSELPIINSDPNRMTQLFHHLVENAIKFGVEKLVIQISSEEVTEENVIKNGLDLGKKYIAIIVADNGIGFDQSYVPKIFGLFQQLNTVNNPGGSGVGLAICKRIVEDHGGLLLASSVVNEGSTFTAILQR